jgi:hypothetical protein
MTSKTMKPPKTPVPIPAVQPEANGVHDGKSDENIRALAFRKWETAGRPVGDGLYYWLEAERELRQA